jgi:hypothetical protein
MTVNDHVSGQKHVGIDRILSVLSGLMQARKGNPCIRFASDITRPLADINFRDLCSAPDHACAKMQGL